MLTNESLQRVDDDAVVLAFYYFWLPGTEWYGPKGNGMA